MIVEPDFPDHWKTQMLIGLCEEYSLEHPGALDREGAPMLVLRLWAHCQQRKQWRFPGMSNETLRAICRWKGEAARLREFLAECGWIERSESEILVHGWAEVNARLVTNWTVGHRGGRPRSEHFTKPSDNPRVSAGKPSDNPRVSARKPSDNRKATVGEPIDQIEKIDKRESTHAHGNLGASEQGLGEKTAGDASIPSVEEVIGFGAAGAGVPEDYCRHFWDERERGQTWWNGHNRLRLWRRDLVSWWRRDEREWRLKKTAGQKTPEDSKELARINAELEWQEDGKKIAELQKRRGELNG
jgi:hypothetical protein